VVNTICATSNPSGRILNDTFEHLSALIIAPLAASMSSVSESSPVRPFDGLLLHLHGAMVTQTHEDAEGVLLERIRAVIGFDVPIVVTLDLHGNITDKMATNASSLIACRTYPHIDFYQRAWQGAELLQR
jgi:microcystin degradation protein MlrC